MPVDPWPSFWECSTTYHYWNQEVWPHHSSSAWSSLASSLAAYQFQAGYDSLQVPAWSGTILPGWRVHSCLVHRRQVDLQSANSGTLVVPGTRTTIGRHNFAVSGPATWNRLSVEVQTLSLYVDTFTKKRKSHLFSCEHLWRLLFIRRYTYGHIDWLIDWYLLSKTSASGSSSLRPNPLSLCKNLDPPLMFRMALDFSLCILLNFQWYTMVAFFYLWKNAYFFIGSVYSTGTRMRIFLARVWEPLI